MTNAKTDIVVSKVARRLIPMLIVLYFLAILDRGAAGFAAITMNRDLGLTAEVFGIGTGLFFVGYLSSEVPANLMLLRFGARRWLARIIFTWGLVAMLTALVQGPLSFYASRFVLGIAEAGFFPGIIYYLTLWFPRAYRARYNAWFMLAIPIAIAAAAPISTSILMLDGYLGLAGWRWVFILEGLPSVLAGIVTWFYLTDKPEDATWLAADERQTLTSVLTQERQNQEKVRKLSALEALRNPVLIAFGLVYGGINVSLVMAANWLPQIAKGFTDSFLSTGAMISLPFLAGAAAMVIWGKWSDVSGQRSTYTAVALAVCGIGWIAAGCFSAPVAVMSAIGVAVVGLYAAMGVFWTLPASYLTQAGAASGIALVSAMGHLASAFSPAIVGRLRDQSGGFSSALVFVGVIALVSAAVVVLTGAAVRRQSRQVLAQASA